MRRFPVLFLFIFIVNVVFSQGAYRSFSPCSFYIELPSSVNAQNLNSYNSDDYCDYMVKLKDGYKFMEIHSLLKSRFSNTSVLALYNSALRSTDLDITYQVKGADFFVLSGYNSKGNIVYWRRSIGQDYISDMRIEYSKGRRASIDPIITRMSKSFYSY
jgi:hypothetical protein